jgi:hypothetical protein
MPASLQAGMTAQADIKTDRRRVIEFFLSPVIKYMDEGTMNLHEESNLKSIILVGALLMSNPSYATCDAIEALIKQYGIHAEGDVVNLPPSGMAGNLQGPSSETLSSRQTIVRILRSHSSGQYQQTLYVDLKNNEAWLLRALSGVATWYGPVAIDAEKFRACDTGSSSSGIGQGP